MLLKEVNVREKIILQNRKNCVIILWCNKLETCAMYKKILFSTDKKTIVTSPIQRKHLNIQQ